MGKKTAAFLSLFIIGLGQFYAGRLWRALAWFFGSVLILSALTLAAGFGGLAAGPPLLAEEENLEKAFEKEYRDYKRRVRRGI